MLELGRGRGGSGGRSMVWGWGERVFSGAGGSILDGFAGGGRGGLICWIGGGSGGGGDRWHVGAAIGVTAMLGVALAATIVLSSRRGSLKSPWSTRKRKHVLTPQQWKGFFTPEGKLCDGGARLLKKVRSGGVDPSIRSEVWPFLLGVYELNSSEDDRNAMRKQKRKEYKRIRKRCQCLLKHSYNGDKMSKDIDESDHMDSPSLSRRHVSPQPEDDAVIEHTLSDEASTFRHGSETTDKSLPSDENSQVGASDAQSGITSTDAPETESSDSDSTSEDRRSTSVATSTARGCNASKSAHTAEDFATWQRIIRLDAVRANAEWVIYAPAQAAVVEEKALKLAEAVGLKDYDHLEPCMIHHAARLVVVLEAYAIYDPDIGYCQGMSDLLSPIISVMEEDDEAFWCFVGFMTKARHNFRLDEVGIRRQLGIVSKIIKFKDPHLYKHLQKLQAEDCFFVYRMVVVLFRRELGFEQTVCLWEVMWADQAAIRSGFGKSAWARIRSQAPPTDDLLLYAVAACVLQRRKTIIERYSSMEEILRECNSMAGHLDVWKLLDDAHDLVVTLHDKIS